jgi:glucose-1-phosphate thymidylyltransferase
MKGIILAGGSGTRLYPITLGICKQLMPIYDKPMIYYPLFSLIQTGIREILIITTPKDLNSFRHLLGDGSKLGCKFEYKTQLLPNGIAQSFILGEEFLAGDSCCLVLGDNIFYGTNLQKSLKLAKKEVEKNQGGLIFAYRVSDPQRYGVVEFNSAQKVICIEEKPQNPKSNYAIPGIYFYSNLAVNAAKKAKPSERGELEITEIHNFFLKQGNLSVKILDKGTAWLDTGTFDSMNQAAQFVQVIEQRQGTKIGCIEEAAFEEGFISSNQLQNLAKPLLKSGYGKYLLQVAESKN